MRSKYICFEGIDGSGKTLQIRMLGDYLDKQGITPIVLSEPSYGPFGRQAREKMADGTIGDIDSQRQLFTADRRDHVTRKIAPALAFVKINPDFILLQSRSYLSAPAYQSEALDDESLALRLTTEQAITPEPDIIVVLDVSVDEALERLRSARRPDLFESPKTLEKVRQRYLKLARISSSCVRVDASGDPESVATRVRGAISERESKA